MATRVTQLNPWTGRWSARPASLGNVFQELEQLLQPLDAAGVNRGAIGAYHAIDLYETDDAVVLQMAVPGVAAEDIDIGIEGRQLSIRGSTEAEVERTDRRYWLKGISLGEFSRSVTVPSGIDSNAIDATVSEGILTVTMPKAPEALSRKIAVGSGSGAKRIGTDSVDADRSGAESVNTAPANVKPEAAERDVTERVPVEV